MSLAVDVETTKDFAAVRSRAAQISAAREPEIRVRANQTFTLLLISEWFAGIIVAFTVVGQNNNFLWGLLAVAFFGAAVCLLPSFLAWRRADAEASGFAAAVGQILWLGLLVSMSGERPEIYLFFFGALAITSIYKDLRVLGAASAAAFLVFLAHRIFAWQTGAATANNLTWFAYLMCLICETAVLLVVCRRSDADRQQTALQTAQFEIDAERYRSIIENTRSNIKNAQSLVENTDDIIFRTDDKGFLTYANRNAARLFGCAENELIGRHFVEFIHREDQFRIKLFYKKQFVRQYTDTYCEFQIESIAGKRFWLGQKVQLLTEDNRRTGFQAISRDISERIRTEKALSESEARSRAVTDSVFDAIVTIDRTNTILFVNQTAEKIFGYQAAELTGANLNRLIPEGLRIRLGSSQPQRSAEVAWRDYLRQTSEVAARHKDGREIPIEISFCEYDAGGKQMFAVVLRDLTERKRTAAVLKKSKEYRNFFKLANDAILIVEPISECILDVNDRACELYGFARSQFVGRSLKTMSENEARGEQRLQDLLQNRLYNEFEMTQRRADGKILSLLINASLIEFAGQPAILSINRDITERKRQDAALRESEYRFRTILESMNEGLLHVDRTDRIQYANDHFCQMVGYSYEELINRVWTNLLLKPEEQALIQTVNERRLRGVADGYELKLNKKTGETIWALVGGAPVYNSDNLIVGSMGVFTDISDRKRAEEQLLHNALHDALTGLPNRALFLEHLRHTIDRNQRRTDAQFAVLFLDFDRFKVVNDSLGHMEGDKLLILIARRLEKSLRTSDIVARLGGDEFTILLTELEQFGEISEIIERIQTDLKAPFILMEREIFISASIGVALSSPKYTKPEEMLRDADTAMYRAKAGGKARYQIFNQTMHNAANERLQLETELRHALERGEFCNYYQPIVELEDNRLVGFESLVRWHHPTRGLILPAEFISTMEETGLIVGLGIWVLRESCRQLREWQTAYQINCPELTMSVNLSCRQFLQTDLAERVEEILRETAVDPDCLRLEITESHVMEDSELAISIMHRLRAIGVKLSIDDFGTGYSSLSYLHRLPINYLKVDRSFVSRMLSNHENAEIVRTIVTLAKNLEIDVIAEGIEMREQAAHLRKLDCKYGQGFLFSRPRTAESAGALVASNKITETPVITGQNVNLLEFIN